MKVALSDPSHYGTPRTATEGFYAFEHILRRVDDGRIDGLRELDLLLGLSTPHAELDQSG
jgi:hypothetical protein